MPNIAKLPATTNILRLWVDHGHAPVNDSYGYVVYCGKKIPGSNLPFKVLRNDTTVQAIQSEDLKVVQSVFYSTKESLVAKNMRISVSDPAIVMIEDLGTEYKITMNDPTMNPELKRITLTIDAKKIEVEMPMQEYCGKPVTVTMKK
ncbi:Chondroitinase-AC precursor [compost metagenome]